MNTPSQAAPRIFVSHSHKDDEFTQRLVSDLHAAGAEVWVDVAGIRHGNFMQRIDEALQRCNWMVLVLTPNAIASEYVRDEVYTALHRVKQHYMRDVIPVLAAPCATASIPPQWDVLQRYDATANYTAALARLLSALGVTPVVSGAARAAASAPASTSPSSRRSGNPVPARAVSPHIASVPSSLPPSRYTDDLELRGILSPAVIEAFPERLEHLGFTTWTANDPRTGKPTALILPPLCIVRGGPFMMGSDPQQDKQAFDTEQPQHTVFLAAFQIALFPVTVAEYACFVAAGHTAPHRGSVGTDWSTQLARLDHPIACVKWQDARDYAAWLQKLTGQRWALPSEAAWEKAARWDPERRTSRVYPWGDRFDGARCNTYASLPETRGTTMVGSFGPEHRWHDGSSPCGAQDMAGNVWEWTSTLYEPYPYTVNDGRESPNATKDRVLRGGSWYDTSTVARSAYRNDGHQPAVALDSIGFRLVLHSSALS